MNPILEIEISRLESLNEAAKALLEFAGTHRVFVFDSPMGSGKTTLIKSVCSVLGVSDAMSSPSYSIINQYKTKTQSTIFHMDLYRLKSQQELTDLGFEEYLDSNYYVFIEWPEFAIPFLDSYIRVSIQLNNNNRYLRAQIIN